MYVVTLVLFVLPVSLLLAALGNWTRPSDSAQSSHSKDYPAYRLYSEKAALILAVAATALELTFWFSWFHNGGSPHGLMPSPGLWTTVGRAGFYMLIATMILGLFATGKRRWLVLGWGVSLFLMVVMVGMLDRD